MYLLTRLLDLECSRIKNVWNFLSLDSNLVNTFSQIYLLLPGDNSPLFWRVIECPWFILDSSTFYSFIFYKFKVLYWDSYDCLQELIFLLSSRLLWKTFSWLFVDSFEMLMIGCFAWSLLCRFSNERLSRVEALFLRMRPKAILLSSDFYVEKKWRD